MVVSYDDSTVRVAEDDLGTHIDEFIDKEQTALEHLLMNQNASLALGRHHKDHTDQVRGKTRPRSIGNMENRPVEEGIDHIALLFRNIDIITASFQIYTKTAENFRNHSEFIVGYVLDGHRTPVHRSKSNERAYLDHIRKDCMFRSS